MKYRDTHKEHELERTNKWRRENREHVNELRQARYDPEKQSISNKKYRQTEHGKALCKKLANTPKSKFFYYGYDAKRRGLDFVLTEEQFKALITSEEGCDYCDKKPKDTEFGILGVDRVDSKKGYTIDNCVTCCSDCNLAKRAMNADEFRQNREFYVERYLKHIKPTLFPKRDARE
jgi:hypothetical protein